VKLMSLFPPMEYLCEDNPAIPASIPYLQQNVDMLLA